MAKADELVAAYINVRDEIAAREEKHKAELGQYKHMLTKLEGKLLETLEQAGGKSIKTDCGTAYLSEVRSFRVADRDAFRSAVIENQDWDLADWRVNRTEAKERDAIPGVESDTILKVNVRRS